MPQYCTLRITITPRGLIWAILVLRCILFLTCNLMPHPHTQIAIQILTMFQTTTSTPTKTTLRATIASTRCSTTHHSRAERLHSPTLYLQSWLRYQTHRKSFPIRGVLQTYQFMVRRSRTLSNYHYFLRNNRSTPTIRRSVMSWAIGLEKLLPKKKINVELKWTRV